MRSTISGAGRRAAAWTGRLALLGAAAALLTGYVTGGAAATSPQQPLAVSSTGSDDGPCTQAAPCASFDRAYRVAQPGQAVEVAAGSYPEQDLNSDYTKTLPDDVVFRPAVGATVIVAGLGVHASHITFQNLSLKTASKSAF